MRRVPALPPIAPANVLRPRAAKERKHRDTSNKPSLKTSSHFGVRNFYRLLLLLETGMQEEMGSHNLHARGAFLLSFHHSILIRQRGYDPAHTCANSPHRTCPNSYGKYVHACLLFLYKNVQNQANVTLQEIFVSRVHRSVILDPKGNFLRFNLCDERFVE